MTEPTLALCPSPECGGECEVLDDDGSGGLVAVFVACRRDYSCGYRGPNHRCTSVDLECAQEQHHAEAIRLHNAIPRARECSDEELLAEFDRARKERQAELLERKEPVCAADLCAYSIRACIALAMKGKR